MKHSEDPNRERSDRVDVIPMVGAWQLAEDFEAKEIAVSNDNVTIMKAYYEAWGSADVDEIEKLCAEDFVGHDPASGDDFDREGLKQRLTLLKVSMPDFHVTSEDIIAQNDRVVFRWRTEATLSDELAVDSRGQMISYTGITIYRLRKGKVAARGRLLSCGTNGTVRVFFKRQA